MFPSIPMSKLGSLLLSLLACAVTVTASEIRFEGNSAIPASDLNQVQVHLSAEDGVLRPDPSGVPTALRQIDASQLSEEAVAQVVRAVSGFYQSRNILATRAEVTRDAYEAAQAGGDLVIRIVEGRVDAVRVASAEGGELRESTRKRLLASSSVQPGGPLDGRALEHAVATINRFSANQVQPVLFATNEGTVLEYRVRPGQPWSAGYAVDNYGSERTGEIRHQADAGFSSLIREDDRLSFTGVLTSSGDSRYFRGDYFSPFGRHYQHRVRLSLYHAGYSAEDVGVAAFDFKGESNGAILAYETTLWSDGGRFLDLSAGVHFLDASQNQASVGIGSESATFLLPFVDLKLSQQTPALSWVAGARIETNLNDINAVKLARLGRFEASDEFVIGRFYGGARIFVDPASRLHELLANGAYIASLGGDRLPASFLSVAGGHSTVRGYRVSAISGDNSAYAQFEYRFHALRLIDPGSRWGAAIGFFYDIGTAKNENALVFEVDETISSHGIGLHAHYGNTFRASIEYARAAQDLITPYDSTESGDDELYFKGSVRF